MIEELILAGRRATRFSLSGDEKQERDTLEFMDSLWDRMTREQRFQALAKLRSAGLEQLAERIERGLSELGTQ
jgi:hypothetical protein